MDYLKVADDLGLFGEKCESFLERGLKTAEERAKMLLQPVTRKEAARWFSMTYTEGLSAPVSEPEPEEEKEEPKACSQDYSVESVSGGFLRFASLSEAPKEIEVVLRNKKPSEEPWTEKCELKLNLATDQATKRSWTTIKNAERRARGFSTVEDLRPLQVLEGLDSPTISLASQTATFRIKIGPGSGRMMDQFHMNGVAPVEEGIYGLYLYAEGPGVSTVNRAFRTSVEKVQVRQLPLNKATVIEQLPAANTPITVRGHAVMGEESKTFKTYMWYPVQTQSGRLGFVEASSVHVEKIGGKLVDTDYGNSGKLWMNVSWPRNKTAYRLNNGCTADQSSSNKSVEEELAKVKGIVLHFTAGNSNKAASNEKDAFTMDASAHYVVDKDGYVAQSAPDYLATGHVGYAGSQTCIRKDGNAFTIGIEVPNWGAAILDENGQYMNHLGNQIIENWTNVKWKKTSFCQETKKKAEKSPNGPLSDAEKSCITDTWLTWSHSKNMAWGGALNNPSHQTWQEFSEGQYKGLARLIEYLQERYDIPYRFFYSGEAKSEATGLSFYPSDSDERKKYNEDLSSFYGIYGHHNVTGKYDPGPQFYIEKMTQYYNQP